jgi:membrane associated rhomboid family serine protease
MSLRLDDLLGLPSEVKLLGSITIVSLAGMIVRPLRDALMLVPYRVVRGGLHRLLTAGWVHAGLWHLFVNMLALHMFGEQVRRVIGWERFLFLFTSGVVVAFVPTTLRHYRDRGYASLGASGGIAAVLIAALLLYPRLEVRVFFLASPVRGGMLAVAYVVYSLLHSAFERDGIDHTAHLAGAVYGGAVAWMFEPGRVERSLHGIF